MSSPFETLCSAIVAAGYEIRRDRNHGTARAQCAGHDSTGYTLSIRETDDGAVLLHCFAGCDSRDILDALGLEPRQLFLATTRGWTP